ncbi:MAG: ATP-binding protein, partial [Clostridiales bacterium]|nr:ATP-binding protein [Clostridiales bacterium]
MSIRVKATLVIILIVFCVTAVNLFSNLHFSKQNITEVMKQELFLARDIADGLVSAKLSSLREDSIKVAGHLFLAGARDGMAEAMESTLADYSDFLAFSVFDKNGIIASCGEEPITMAEIADEAKFVDMAFSGKTVTTTRNGNIETDDQVIMHILTPVGSSRVLAVSIPGMLFSDMLTEFRIWDTGGMYIFDAEGTIIAGYREDFVRERRNFIIEGETDTQLHGISAFYKDMISSEAGSGQYYFGGEERLCAYKRISESVAGWYIAVVLPLSGSPGAGVQTNLMFITAVFLFAGVIIAILMSDRIARPFVKINEQNRALEELNKTIVAQSEKLSAAHERAMIMLDATPLCCNLWNRDLVTFDCNAEAVKLFGLRDKQDYLDNFIRLSPEYQYDGKRSGDLVPGLVQKAFEEGIIRFEWMHQKLDGTPVPVEMTLVRVAYGDDYAIAAYARDLREYKKMMGEIEKQDNLLSTINLAATLLLKSDVKEFENELQRSMGMMAKAVDADRMYICRNSVIGGKLYRKRLYEWQSADGPRENTYSGKYIPYSETPWIAEKLSGEECINTIVRDVPSIERERFCSEGIKSLLVAPVFMRGEFWGFVGFDNCHSEEVFSEDEVSILRSGSLMIAHAFLRNEMTQSIVTTAAKLEAVVTNYPGIIWTVDNNEEITLFNGRYLKQIGIKPGFVEGSTVEEAKKKNPHIGVIANVDKTLSEGPQDWMSEIGQKHFHARTMPVYSSSGQAASVVGCVDDLTEIVDLQKDLEAALKEAQNANEAKSDFLARMSHEMRTPLNAVIGLSELLLDTRDFDGEDFIKLDKISNAGRTLLNTVNDILDISKIEAGRMELVPIEYDTPSLINDAVAQSVLHKGEKEIQFLLNISEKLPARLYGDELRVKQMFNNLLSNAFKYTKEGIVGLDIDGVRKGDEFWVAARIRDTGIGITQKNIDSLFDDYVQVDTKANRHIMGTGLGLSITRRMVELMGGTIKVESEYGKGSVFTLNFPQGFVTDAVIGPEVAKNLQNFNYTVGKRRNPHKTHLRLPYAKVLVVDDIINNLDVAKGMMSPYGMQIDCVTSGQQAIDAIRNENVKYSAVFMDHMMPGMDGVEATKIIREEIGTEYAKTVPIIALTANAISGSEQMFLKSGFQDFISKPIEMNRLDTVIRKWIRDKELEKTLGKHVYPGKKTAFRTRSGRDRRVLPTRRGGGGQRTAGKLTVEGLDMSKGVERFSGDEKLFMQILRSYAVNTVPLLEQLKNVSKNNLGDYSITVHGVKSSSRGIYADALGNMAEALEMASKDGDWDYVEAKNSEMIETAQKLIEDIETMLAKAA